MPAFKFEWAPCPCGHSACTIQYPTNIGTFYQGSGFHPHEVDILNALARNAADANAARDEASRLRNPDNTGQ